MSKMNEALERISNYYDFHAPSPSREAVEKELKFYPFKVSCEVYEFYQWAGAPRGKYAPIGLEEECEESGYSCLLEEALGSGSDLIHLLSLEEAREWYGNYWALSDIMDAKCIPFVSFENGELAILGSETETDTSPVVRRADTSGSHPIWFPSLTSMMLAIAESLERAGGLGFNFRDRSGAELSRDAQSKQFQLSAEIAKKYGSPSGRIFTNL